jgi:hypothetical protein
VSARSGLELKSLKPRGVPHSRDERLRKEDPCANNVFDAVNNSKAMISLSTIKDHELTAFSQNKRKEPDVLAANTSSLFPYVPYTPFAYTL